MRKGQIKIQEMAFVLVALVVFFALVGLLYLSYRLHGVREAASDLEAEQAAALVRRIAGTPELRWGACAGCIDLDKAVVLGEHNRTSFYREAWGLDYLQIERLYPVPAQPRACSTGTYPACSTLTLLNASSYGVTSQAYVSLCFWDAQIEQERCELGVIYASGGSVNHA